MPAAKVADLRQQGVSDAVLNYMQETYLQAVRRDQRLEDETLWFEGPDRLFYGGCFYWARPWC